MKHYSQLTLEKRYGIYLLLKTGLTQSKIAEVIGTLVENLNVTAEIEAIDPNRPMHLQKTDNRESLKIE